MSFTDFCQRFSISVVSCLVLVFGCSPSPAVGFVPGSAALLILDHMQQQQRWRLSCSLIPAFLSLCSPEGSSDQIPRPAHIL